MGEFISTAQLYLSAAAIMFTLFFFVFLLNGRVKKKYAENLKKAYSIIPEKREDIIQSLDKIVRSFLKAEAPLRSRLRSYRFFFIAGVLFLLTALIYYALDAIGIKPGVVFLYKNMFNIEIEWIGRLPMMGGWFCAFAGLVFFIILILQLERFDIHE